jgi:hypothetical protein
MKKVFLMVFRLSLVSFACLLILGVTFSPLAEAQPQPPEQDYYLHFSQKIELSGGVAAWDVSGHELAWVETPGDLTVSDALTVEAWVLWDGSDLEEIQLATGIDLNRMTLFCGQRAYGFYYRTPRKPEVEGWTFFLQTDSTLVLDAGNIPLPIGEWAHLAATYDGATVKTFLNGILQHERPVSGTIPVVGTAFQQYDCPYFAYSGGELEVADTFGIGLGTGFEGGVRQLRIWNRALSAAEIVANAGLHLAGIEPGLVGYWPMDSALDPSQAPNKVAGGPPLILGTDQEGFPAPNHAMWHLTDPMFVVREDLAEDAVVTDCPTLFSWVGPNWSLVNVQDDEDLDLVFSGQISGAELVLTPFNAMIRDGENGFVFDTTSAFAGPIPGALTPSDSGNVTADFNGDGRLDIFAGNVGVDFKGDAGAVNTLILSRPDGRLEDASGNLLAPPCDQDEPVFAGQHMCFGGSDYGGRTPGIRYPGPGAPVPPARDFSNSAVGGDFDDDGDIDILVGNPAGSLETSYFMINDGSGNFLANWQLLPDFLYQEDPQVRGFNPNNYLLEDMDGDGKMDLVTAPVGYNGEVPAIWNGGIYWNDGSGDFSEATLMPFVPTPGIPIGYHHSGDPNGIPESEGGMAAMDIDNDGDKDMLVTWGPEVDNNIFPSSLQVWVNKGDRVFVDETVARVGAPPQDGMPRQLITVVYALDLNQDGCKDLLFPDNAPPHDSPLWLNNCPGYFTPLTEPVFPKRLGIWVPLDYDGDGDIDLIHMRPETTRYAGLEGCDENEGHIDASDHIDFAVLLNVNPGRFKYPYIFRSGFEDGEQYVADPNTPVVAISIPPSPADDKFPDIIGSAEAGSTVKLYSDNICSVLLASGTAHEFSTTGITINVASGSITEVYANATDEEANVSACSSPALTYVERGCDDVVGVWAPEARDCTTEDCSDGRWRSWDGRTWCRALITQEGGSWTVTVPPGTDTFDFWADWGAWDLNDCGDGISSISIAACDLNAMIVRGGDEQNLVCDVTGHDSIFIKHAGQQCDYVIIGDPVFY